MTVTASRKARLRRIVKEEVVRALFREQGTPAQQAKAMGLVKAPGFGNYADPNTGQITHQSKGGQLVPTEKGKAAGAQAPTQPKAPPAGGEAPTQRPPTADIPQTQEPAPGEPAQPAQRGGPEVGAAPELPKGPEMPEPRVAKALRKGLNVNAINLAASTGDTDEVRKGIDFVARIKDEVETKGSEDDKRVLPGLEKAQRMLQKKFGEALKQKQALQQFGGEEEQHKPGQVPAIPSPTPATR